MGSEKTSLVDFWKWWAWRVTVKVADAIFSTYLLKFLNKIWIGCFLLREIACNVLTNSKMSQRYCNPEKIRKEQLNRWLKHVLVGIWISLGRLKDDWEALLILIQAQLEHWSRFGGLRAVLWIELLFYWNLFHQNFI